MQLEEDQKYFLELEIDNETKLYSHIKIVDDNGNLVISEAISDISVGAEPKFFVDNVTIAVEIDGRNGSVIYYNLTVEKETTESELPLIDVILETESTSYLAQQKFNITLGDEFDNDKNKVIEFYNSRGRLLVKIFNYSGQEWFTLAPYSSYTVKVRYDGDSSPMLQQKIATIGSDNSISFAFLNYSNRFTSRDGIHYYPRPPSAYFETNMLHLPVVKVGDATYNVSMELIDFDQIIFELRTAEQVEASGNQVAIFNPISGFLDIPSVKVENEVFSARLMWDNEQPNLYRFILTEFNRIP